MSFFTCIRDWVAVLSFLLLSGLGGLRAQTTAVEEPASPRTTWEDPESFAWFNTYGRIRLSERFYWIAQTHFRFHQSDRLAYLGQPAQLYNRHALAYRPNPNMLISAGGVLRLNFNQDEVPDDEFRTIPEWRLWHEYLFCQPLERFKLYHRIRLEHRWTRGFHRGLADWTYRNRYRYLIGAKVPLNKTKLKPGALYLAPEAELIMQSGQTVVDSPLEDLRLTTTLGYVVSPQLTLAAGFMYSFGQDLKDGTVWKQKQTLRVHMYFSPDWRRPRARLAEVVNE